jgi:hypothetical protein
MIMSHAESSRSRSVLGAPFDNDDVLGAPSRSVSLSFHCAAGGSTIPVVAVFDTATL